MAPGFPLDAPLIVLYVAAMAALVLSTPAGVPGPLRVLAGLPLLLFLPGYVLLAVLYPGQWRDATTEAGTGRPSVLDREGLTWGERAAISFAASLALLPMLAVVLSVARLPLDPVPITLSLGAVTVLGAVVGALRRLQLPPSRRFRLPLHRWWTEIRRGTVEAPSTGDALLNVLLVLALVGALTGLAYGLAAPPSGPGYTEPALLTEQDGELVTGNYTTEFAPGESAPMVFSVENQEGGERSYTTVVVLERVRGSGENFTVVEREELTRLSMTVADGEIARERHTVSPTMRGEDLRLSYYLYVGDAPDSVSDARADKHLYIWVSVGGGADGNASASLQQPRVPGAA